MKKTKNTGQVPAFGGDASAPAEGMPVVAGKAQIFQRWSQKRATEAFLPSQPGRRQLRLS